MNSPLSQSDLSNVMLWQTLSFTCQTVLEIRGEKKNLVNHSGCISLLQKKNQIENWNIVILFPPQGNLGVGEINKNLLFTVWGTRGHITLVRFKFSSSAKEAPFSLFVHFCHPSHHIQWVMQARGRLYYNPKIYSVNNHGLMGSQRHLGPVSLRMLGNFIGIFHIGLPEL